MVKFAEFQSRPLGNVDVMVEVDPMMPTDTEICAQLAADRECMDLGIWSNLFHRLLEDPSQMVLVARLEQQVVGYGKASFLKPLQQGGWGAPEGWYLTGLVVDPKLRRRGVGRQLTQGRLESLAARGIHHVWYFANARNTVTLQLHRHLGFREVTRNFSIPGVTFWGGVGVLSCWETTPLLL